MIVGHEVRLLFRQLKSGDADGESLFGLDLGETLVGNLLDMRLSVIFLDGKCTRLRKVEGIDHATKLLAQRRSWVGSGLRDVCLQGDSRVGTHWQHLVGCAAAKLGGKNGHSDDSFADRRTRLEHGQSRYLRARNEVEHTSHDDRGEYSGVCRAEEIKSLRRRAWFCIAVNFMSHAIYQCCHTLQFVAVEMLDVREKGFVVFF